MVYHLKAVFESLDNISDKSVCKLRPVHTGNFSASLGAIFTFDGSKGVEQRCEDL